MLIALKSVGFIMIVGACYIAGTIAENAKQKSINELSGVIRALEQILNAIRCDKTTIFEAMLGIASHKSIIGQIAQNAVKEYEAKKNVQLNDILLDNLAVFKKDGVITPCALDSLEYLFERLGRNDLEYQICILSETIDNLNSEYLKLNSDYTKTKGMYVKSSLCIGVIVAVLFI